MDEKKVRNSSCTFCNISLSFDKKGLQGIKNHANSENHVKIIWERATGSQGEIVVPSSSSSNLGIYNAKEESTKAELV